MYFTNVAAGQSFSAMDEVAMETSRDLYMIHAKLIDKRTGTGAAGKRAFVSIPGPQFEMLTTLSDSAGNLVFLMRDIDQSKQLIFQTNTAFDSIYTFEFGRSLEKFPSRRVQDASEWPVDTLPFYGKADKEYLLDDYVRFPTMEEVMREYVFEVALRKQKEEFRFRVLNTPFQTYFDEDPLILLDGIPVFDMDRLMALDPLKIRKLEVVARKYFLGSLICNGIVSFSSYNGDLAGYTLPREAAVRDISTLSSK